MENFMSPPKVNRYYINIFIKNKELIGFLNRYEKNFQKNFQKNFWKMERIEGGGSMKEGHNMQRKGYLL